jgi:hypothetical protein
MGRTLREVRDEDLPLLFEQWADPVRRTHGAFTARDHMDWDAFERRWSRLRADETVLARVIVAVSFLMCPFCVRGLVSNSTTRLLIDPKRRRPRRDR